MIFEFIELLKHNISALNMLFISPDCLFTALMCPGTHNQLFTFSIRAKVSRAMTTILMFKIYPNLGQILNVMDLMQASEG